jgi:hypothetical protein
MRENPNRISRRRERAEDGEAVEQTLPIDGEFF